MLSLLVRWRLYAVWLERSYNGVPIRGRSKSPVPTRRSLVAPDPLSFAQFNQLQKRECAHTHTRTRTHLCRSHIIRSTFSPSGFFFSATDWRMKPLNQRVKPWLPSNQPDFLLPLLLQIRTQDAHRLVQRFTSRKHPAGSERARQNQISYGVFQSVYRHSTAHCIQSGALILTR